MIIAFGAKGKETMMFLSGPYELIWEDGESLEVPNMSDTMQNL